MSASVIAVLADKVLEKVRKNDINVRRLIYLRVGEMRYRKTAFDAVATKLV